MKRVAHHLSPYGELAPGPGFAMPERLVGLGFRHWLQGYRTGDIASWEKVWCSYSSAMGAASREDCCRPTLLLGTRHQHAHPSRPEDLSGRLRRLLP